MLAHTSLRHLMLSTQFVIGVVLLSASYLSHEQHGLIDQQLKINSQMNESIETHEEKSKNC